ncbi:MAG: hypothetical protein N3A38_14515, partial [Planctomycetota bacterium]|nr:hypothetical protein [Planctomycetota bacterium]
GCSIGGTVWPVFAPLAERARSYAGSSGPWDRAMSNGEVGPWTPARFLMYLYVVANLLRDIPGGGGCHSLASSDRIRFPASALERIVAGEGTQGLDDEMPDVSYDGKTLLLALHETLDLGGYYALGLDYPLGSAYSVIAFRPRTQGAIYDDEADAISFTLQRGGRIGELEEISICDFEAEIDATFARDQWRVYGEPAKVETGLVYDPANPDSSSIRPAWTADERAAFAAIIKGDGTYAKYPKDQGALDGDWLTADGSGGRPLIYAKTKEAFSFARLLLPRVWAAWRVVSSSSGVLTALAGYDGRYSNQSNYPVVSLGNSISHGRPIYREQLQPLISESGVEGTGAVRYPVRLTFLAGWPNGDESKVDAGNLGLRVSPDGLIWLDGLVDAEGTADSIYEGYYYGVSADPDNVVPRAFALNAAMPADHRVIGTATRPEGSRVLDLASSLGGAHACGVSISPQTYREHHQVASSPAPHARFRSGSGVVEAPLTRLIPPNSGAEDATAAARRALVERGGIAHRSRWEAPGILAEWRAGKWLEKVVLKIPGEGDEEYAVGAMIPSVTWDFGAQITATGEIV